MLVYLLSSVFVRVISHCRVNNRGGMMSYWPPFTFTSTWGRLWKYHHSLATEMTFSGFHWICFLILSRQISWISNPKVLQICWMHEKIKEKLPHFRFMCQLLDTAAALSASYPENHQSDIWVIIISHHHISFFLITISRHFFSYFLIIISHHFFLIFCQNQFWWKVFFNDIVSWKTNINIHAQRLEDVRKCGVMMPTKRQI